MMGNSGNRILDEFAKLATDAAGVAQGVRQEVDLVLRSQIERVLGKFDLVQREEFEAVKEMASKARAENEELAAKIATLEARILAEDKNQ